MAGFWKLRGRRSRLPRDRRSRRHRASRPATCSRAPTRSCTRCVRSGSKPATRVAACCPNGSQPDARVPRRAAGRLVLRADQLPALGARDRLHPRKTPTRRRSISHERSPIGRGGRRRRGRHPRREAASRTARSRASASFADARRPAARPPARRPLDRRGDALHVGHDRQAEGREARARRHRPRHRAPSCSRSCSGCSASRTRDDNVHLCTSPNYHTAVTTFAGNALHIEAHGRVHGQVGSGGDAAR